MNGIIVVAKTMKNNDIDIKAYRRKDDAIDDVMSGMYGQYWYTDDGDQESSADIKDAFDNLEEYGWYASDDGSIIVIKEVEVR